MKVLRKEADGTPRVKRFRDSFLMDRNSRTRIAGYVREEAGPWPDDTFLFLKSEDLPDHTCTERLLGGQREVMPRDVPYPYAFSVKSILAKRCVCTHGRILRCTKYGPGKSK